MNASGALNEILKQTSLDLTSTVALGNGRYQATRLTSFSSDALWTLASY